jgi:16S rRNA processing protein RimM
VGRILKPHGLAGEVVVDLFTDRRERLAPGTVLGAGAATLTVTAARPHQGRYLVRFAGVGDREAAEGLRGTALTAEAPPEDGTLWVHRLIGARVSDRRGRDLGPVTGVEANPAADLLVLEGGALVPLTFVVAGPEGDPPVLTVELPDGLLDL